MKLLATVTTSGTLTLENVKPNIPIFFIHQHNGSYPANARSLVGLHVSSAGTDYEFADSATHYFGCDRRTGSTYHTNQVMIFVPSKDSITVSFGSSNPPTAKNRILIFQ